MNKRINLLMHIATWLMIFISPILFSHDVSISFINMVTFAIFPICMMTVFYTNYCWLVPQYYIPHNEKFYWAFNIAMIIILALLMHAWMELIRPLFPDDLHRHHTPSASKQFFFVMRNIFNLTVVAAIATTIELSKRWHQAEDEKLELEAARKDAELKNLRSQINPHFLLNTLNNIYALTAFDKEKAQSAIMELSKLLRHMLYDNQRNLVNLKEEVLFIDNYVNLMKIRLPEHVEVRYRTDIPEPCHIEVAPLLFISLIENAFKHGVSPTEKSLIDINIHASNELLTCNIQNTNFPKTQEDRSGHGIGLQQVEHRLHLAYPNKYTWTRGTSPDKKTYISKIVINL